MCKIQIQKNLFGGVICLNEKRDWASEWTGRTRSEVEDGAVVQGVYNIPPRLSFSDSGGKGVFLEEYRGDLCHEQFM